MKNNIIKEALEILAEINAKGNSVERAAASILYRDLSNFVDDEISYKKISDTMKKIKKMVLRVGFEPTTSSV